MAKGGDNPNGKGATTRGKEKKSIGGSGRRRTARPLASICPRQNTGPVQRQGAASGVGINDAK